MRTHNGQLLLSPTDLNDFLACPHLTALEVAVARGEIQRPVRVNPHADLIRRKGDVHEAQYLAGLEGAGLAIADLSSDRKAWEDAARRTAEAIRYAAADVIYQPCLASDGWRGYADFLERQSDGTYEVVDTKLARRA